MITSRTLLMVAGLGATAQVTADTPSVTWTAAFRYRLEQVQQDSFDHAAVASTARLRLGAQLAWNERWRGFAEGEAVGATTDRFNSGANGQVDYPTVADASALEINQLGIAWRATQLEMIVGRQRLVFDNQRFIGNVGWRQNEQTFDAALVAFQPNERWALHYSWLDRVHRVAGDRARDPLARERDLDAHLVHATMSTGAGPLALYFYGVEDQDVAGASTQTTGVRWTPTMTRNAWRWNATLETAQQRDFGHNPRRFEHGYRLLEGAVGKGAWNARLGRERLAGDGTHALQTPLATLHAFNGWADMFVITPPRGLQDRYAAMNGTWSPRASAGLDWAVAWHAYAPTQPGERYGREWNASVAHKFARGWSALIKFADYQSDTFGHDTRKWWLQLEWTK